MWFFKKYTETLKLLNPELKLIKIAFLLNSCKFLQMTLQKQRENFLICLTKSRKKFKVENFKKADKIKLWNPLSTQILFQVYSNSIHIWQNMWLGEKSKKKKKNSVYAFPRKLFAILNFSWYWILLCERLIEIVQMQCLNIRLVRLSSR